MVIEVDLNKDKILILMDDDDQRKANRLLNSFEDYKIITSNVDIIILRNYG